jgi:hypothetical protein
MRTGSILSALCIVVGLAAHAAAADHDFPVDPGSLSIRQTPAGTKIKFRARKGSVSITAAESPLPSGAQLQIFNSAGGTDDLCAQLPASNWTVKSVEDGLPVSFVYRDSHNLYGPVRSAHFGRVGQTDLGDIRAVLRNSSYTLDEASQGSVGVSLRMANLLPPAYTNHTRYCTDFAPPYATIVADAAGIFRAKFNSPNQFGGPCPVAPSACSASGAFLDPE